MSENLDTTHDAQRRSWVESANAADTDFPVQNLPFGAFAPKGEVASRVGVAIGDRILDVVGVLDAGLLRDEAGVAAQACRSGVLNDLMGLGRRHVRALRGRLCELLSEGCDEIAETGRVDELLVRIADVDMHVPARIGDYTDFYASVHHATNVGSMFRPDNPLLPNYKWIPIGYHGRASSIVVSGGPVPRPEGQSKAPDADAPTFGPTQRMDYEMEVGVFVGEGNALGQPIPIARAEDHLFGLCLVNDWSARDIQPWEYQPLGPFLAKSFVTTISPWVVTMDALAPFRVAPPARPEGDPAPLPYLDHADVKSRGGIDLTLEVYVQSQKMRDEGIEPMRLSRGSFTDMYWTVSQLLTHHASNGCNMRPGDLLASGTVSGPTKDARGCMLELTWRGTEPIELPSGEQRRFLLDGDEIIMRGRCERDGAVSIGFGECRGIVGSKGSEA